MLKITRWKKAQIFCAQFSSISNIKSQNNPAFNLPWSTKKDWKKVDCKNLKIYSYRQKLLQPNQSHTGFLRKTKFLWQNNGDSKWQRGHGKRFRRKEKGNISKNEVVHNRLLTQWVTEYWTWASNLTTVSAFQMVWSSELQIFGPWFASTC